MKEEGQVNPSQYISQRENDKNLCILGEDAKQSEDESCEDLIVLKAWLRVNSEFSFSDKDLTKFLTQKTRDYTLCISEDYSNYDSQKCAVGGSYGFWSNLNYDTPGVYYISYHTTAEFDYCEACGFFRGHDAKACGYEMVDLRTKENKITTMERTEQHLLDVLRQLREDIAIVARGNK